MLISDINKRRQHYETNKELEAKEEKEVVEKNDKSVCKNFGGIDIEEAKRFLEEEREIDKKLFRDRIKREHRVRLKLSNFFELIKSNNHLTSIFCFKEKRLKEKDQRRAKRRKVS